MFMIYFNIELDECQIVCGQVLSCPYSYNEKTEEISLVKSRNVSLEIV